MGNTSASLMPPPSAFFEPRSRISPGTTPNSIFASTTNTSSEVDLPVNGSGTQAVRGTPPVDRQQVALNTINQINGTIARNMRSGNGPRGKCYLDGVGVPAVMDAMSKVYGLKPGAASQGGDGLGASMPYVISPWVAANTFAQDPRFQEVTEEYRGQLPPDGSLTFFQRPGEPGHIEFNVRQNDGSVVAYSDGRWPVNPNDPERTHRYTARRVFVPKPEFAEQLLDRALQNENNASPEVAAILNNARAQLSGEGTQTVTSNPRENNTQTTGTPVGSRTTGADALAELNKLRLERLVREMRDRQPPRT